MNHDESSIDDPVDRLFALAKAGAEQGPYGHPLMTPTFTIDEMDVRQLFAGANDHLIRFYEQAKFNTLDRPKIGGHWKLLSFYQTKTIINGEYLPHLASYVEPCRTYSPYRILFEPGDRCHRIDLAVLVTTCGS